MDIKELKSVISSNLEHHINISTPNHEISEIYKYAVLPAGKLFRPQLVWAIAKDFSTLTSDEVTGKGSNHSFLSSGIECHHAYSLVHDDMPCMDNDDYRRGKLSTHKKYGEWKALLIGDGLLNISYRMISRIHSSNLSQIFKFFSWSLGAKGLIQGQVLDLCEDVKKSFIQIRSTHEYKTARLIQAAMICSYLAIPNNKILNSKYSNYRQIIDILKLGLHTGLVFQFIDDLTEFADEALSDHEKTISPWINFTDTTYQELISGLETIHRLSKKHNLEHFSSVMKTYFQNTYEKIYGKEDLINKNFHESNIKSLDLAPIMSLLNSLC